ncbi:spherulation-specific family 4 protein [Streptomyces yaizuensis]|uniref:Spherulation-specific family 4 protein n=1 Tax=Streptomyces yaizuensis TaxID=2989713 RepID=A0ABQ5NVY0_9ACTN|nr:spherulation-specific family 4 protein [Streptomyces sp. YSPA8]GLF94518.1 spherulation-specific family 4 protein [Streptomyces sp. YSPA8]
MPYLTRAGAPLSATGAERLGFGVPGYAHPLLAPVEWAELTRPGIPLHWVVLNVADGPGDRPDPHCLAAAGRLNNAGVRVLGHLDLAHGTRPLAEVIADARRYADWYRVGGFLLGRCPADRARLAPVSRTTATLREVTGGGHIVLGHGTHPCPGYADAADQLVTFSGAWTDYRWSQVAEWTAEHPPERFAHFVHGVPLARLEEAARIARWQGAGTVFFTDRTDVQEPGPAPGGRRAQISPYEALPGYWDEIVSRIGPGVSE